MNKPLITLDHRAIIIWLSICALLVAIMVGVGGYTRLSGSGLSITQWKPIHGVLPPLNEDEWQEEFAGYKTTPQYELVNKGMQLAEFKTIFWPEFFHRLLARSVGIIFFFPLLVFALRKSISQRFFWRLAGIFALGGLQGVIGWVMVASGLVNNPYVSHFKLAMHLSLAFAIFALILWQILVASGKWQVASKENIVSAYHLPLTTYYLWLAALILQIILGALVAGLHAGLVYNSWPLMNGQFVPDGLLEWPWLENLTFIQFLHRNIAVLVAFGFLFWWHSHRGYVKNNRLGKACLMVALVIFVQFMLGVLTLVKVVPLHLALTHQMTALLLWAGAIYIYYRLKHD